MRISDWSSDVCSSDLDFVVERPKDRGHGDFSTNAAMLLARPAKSNPRALAQALVDALPPNDDIAAVEIAGPGFLNFRLATGAWQRQLREVHAQGPAYGRNDRSEEHTSELQSLMRISYAVFCLKKNTTIT